MTEGDKNNFFDNMRLKVTGRIKALEHFNYQFDGFGQKNLKARDRAHLKSIVNINKYFVILRMELMII